MREMTSREKTILAITAGLAAVSLLFNFVIEPFRVQDARLNAAINVSRLKLQRAQSLLSHQDFFRTRYPQLYTDCTVSASALPGSTSVMVELEGLAKGAQLAVLDIRPEVSGEMRGGREINIEMRAEGKIEEIMKFLYDYENSLSLARIKRFALDVRPHSQMLEARFSFVATDFAPSSKMVTADRRRGEDLVHD